MDKYSERLIKKYPTAAAVQARLDELSDIRLSGRVLTVEETAEEEWLLDREAKQPEPVTLEVQNLRMPIR